MRQTIASAVDLGMSLTGRLLAFARRQHLDPEVVDLDALVDGMTDLIGCALRDGLVLEVNGASDPLPVLIDPGQMESAILNLCLNAAQDIEGKGSITLTLDRIGAQARLEVRDTGCGMSPEVLAHAMEPFFTARADGTGTGLGLAMVYGFIRQSGGAVQIDSAPAKGTRVVLTLPLQEGPAAIPDFPRLGTVLLVEDDPADLETARTMLAPHADALICCATAKDAHQRLAGHAFDLVVTDLSLGRKVEGWGIAEAVLARSDRTCVLVVSGNLPDTVPAKGHDPDRIATLPKPMTAGACAMALSTLFKKGRKDAPGTSSHHL